MLVSI
ncbi:UNVERIFIED_CONTAM: hypothetical protein GTU68_010697 [Idotea baltica]|jgi:hypothetical protein